MPVARQEYDTMKPRQFSGCLPADDMFAAGLSCAGVSRVGFVTQLDRLGIPVAAAFRPNARSVSVNHGKGLTNDGALASAVGEAIEVSHAETIGLDTVRSSYRDLRQEGAAINPHRLLQRSGSSFDESLTVEWLWASHLATSDPRLVPFDSVCLDTTRLRSEPEPNLVASSSGFGTGATIEDAVAHGLCELIERDAHTLWKMKSKDRQNQMRISLAGIGDDDCRSLIDRCEAAGLLVAAWNITSDIGVPVILIALVERYRQSPTFVPYALGSGCHPDLNVALVKAITEAAQMRLLQITAVRDDLKNEDYSQENQSIWRKMLTDLTAHSPTATGSNEPKYPSCSAFLEHVVARFRQADIDGPHVLNLTKAELGVPVVKIIAPGLEDAIDGTDQRLGQRAMSALMGGA